MTTEAKDPKDELIKQTAMAMAVAYWRGAITPRIHDQPGEYEEAVKRNAKADSERWEGAARMQLSFILDCCKPLEWK